MKLICQLLIFTCYTTFAFTAVSQDFSEIEGKILTADTKVPVPFAAIGLSGSGIGTICDDAGNFELKIPHNYNGKEMCVSALGFKQTCMTPSGLQGANATVFLEPANIELATVEIKTLSAESLVKEAIRRIPENYADKPVLYTFYQRQIEILNDRPAFIIESVNEAYFKYTKEDYELKILKSRGMAKGNNESRMNKTRISFYDILSSSDLKGYQDFLKLSKIKNYQFTFQQQDILGNDTIYIISFKPKNKSGSEEVAGQEGRLFLHQRSKAIMRLETQANNSLLQKYGKSMILKFASKLTDTEVSFLGFSTQIDFKQLENRWYLSQIKSEGKIIKSGENYSKPLLVNGIRQVVVTKIQTKNAEEIPENQRVKPNNNLYSTASKDMNEEYWEQYNVLPLPEAFINSKAN